MRKHRRLHRREKKLRNRKIIITSICLLLIISVGYGAFQTQLSLSAKGNVVKKPVVEFDGTSVTLVTSGDGLYKDAYEDNRYVYKGTSPNNYITFNNETWRIISIESDNTLKIVRNDVLSESMAWSSECASTYSWETSTLKTYLNGTYYSSLSDTSDIDNHTWNVGVVSFGNNSLSTDIEQEKATLWTGNIGFPIIA